MDIPMLADVGHNIAKDYGVLDPANNIAFRGTFIINGEGVVKHLSVNDLGVGRNVDEYLRLVQAFQHNEKHGEVCQADWAPGKKSMNLEEGKLREFWQAWKKDNAKWLINYYQLSIPFYFISAIQLNLLDTFFFHTLITPSSPDEENVVPSKFHDNRHTSSWWASILEVISI